MKQTILITLISIVLVSSVLSQSVANSSDSSERLRKDYNRVPVVAHVRILNVRAWESRNQRNMLEPQKPYDINLVTCKVIEPLKGKIKKGQTLEVYIEADKSYRFSAYDGEKVLFLSRFYAWGNHRWVYSGSESTWRDYSEEVIAKIKEISR